MVQLSILMCRTVCCAADFAICARGVVFGEGETLRTVYDRRVPLYRMYADITYTHGREPIEVSLAGLIALLGCEKSGTAEVKDE